MLGPKLSSLGKVFYFHLHLMLAMFFYAYGMDICVTYMTLVVKLIALKVISKLSPTMNMMPSISNPQIGKGHVPSQKKGCDRLYRNLCPLHDKCPYARKG